MSNFEDRLKKLLEEGVESSSDKTNACPECGTRYDAVTIPESGMGYAACPSCGNTLNTAGVKEGEFGGTEVEKDPIVEPRQKEIEYILQNQDKDGDRIVKFSSDQLEYMDSSEITQIYDEIHKAVGFQEKVVKVTQQRLTNRADQINSILKKEKDVLNPEHWFKNIINFHDVTDDEIDRLYNRIEDVLKLTSIKNDSGLREDSMDEKHLKTSKEKLDFILQQQSNLVPDVKDHFRREDLKLFANKYIDKLYKQLEKQFQQKIGIAEEVDWDQISQSIADKDYARVANIFDTTTQLGAEGIVDVLIGKGYSAGVIEQIVKEIFGEPEIPDYFKDKLAAAANSSQPTMEDSIRESGGGGTTAGIAVASGSGADVDRKKMDTWGPDGEKIDTWTETDKEKIKPIKEDGTMGATMGQLDFKTDPVEVDSLKNAVEDAIYIDESTIDWNSVQNSFHTYITEVFDKNYGDDCEDPTHKKMTECLCQYSSENEVKEILEGFERKVTNKDETLKFPDFKKHIQEYILEKKSNISNTKGKISTQKQIFKNNEVQNTSIKIHNSMINEARYPVAESDIRTLDKAVEAGGFKLLAVRGALLESKSEDKLEIVIEKITINPYANPLRALIEYHDNSAMPFVVQGKEFTTIQTALGFIRANEDRFIVEQVEDYTNSEAQKRALKEEKKLKDYTDKAYANYAKERAKFGGKEEELVKRVLSESQLKKGIGDQTLEWSDEVKKKLNESTSKTDAYYAEGKFPEAGQE